MRYKADLNIPTFLWHAIFIVLSLSLVIPTTLPNLTQALQGVDILYYLYLLIPAVVTMLAVREAWHYLTRL